MQEPHKKEFPAVGWIKRFGLAGFLFFLIKGLLWIVVPTLLGYFGYATLP